jgi:hypothetical protein
MVEWTSMLPSIAIAAFAERQIEGRRVLLFGSATQSLWAKALERGARLVHVCDPDPVRLSEAAARNTSPLVSFAPLSSQASLALRDGAFDLGIVDNIAALGDMPSVLRLLRRALSPRGLAFIAAPNPDVGESLLPDVAAPRHALNYYSLYDLVRAEFRIVRMLGQMPFVGYTVAELAPIDNPEPTLDAGFVPGGTEEPEWFVAAASAHPFDLESFTVVQVPVSEVLHHSSERQLREQLLASRNTERSAVERLARLDAQQSELLARAVEERNQAELARQVAHLKEELNRKENWIVSLEARASAADARSRDAQHQLEQAHLQLESGALVEARRTQLELELLEATDRAKNADQLAADMAADVASLETQLKDRGARLRALEAELKAVGLVGEQLLRELEALRKCQSQRFGVQTWSDAAQINALPESSGTDTAQSPEKTSAWVSRLANKDQVTNELPNQETEGLALADDRARLQADIHAAAWRIDQLLSVLNENSDAQEKMTSLKSQLSQAETRLNEQAVLLNQLECDAHRS